MAWVICIIAIGLGVAIGMTQLKKQKQLLADGKIIQRKYDIAKQAEEFTLAGADFARVLQGIQSADFSGSGVSIKQNESQQAFFFQGSDWTAELYRQEDVDSKNVWHFNFTHWKTHNGVTQNVLAMNIVLTAVEKIFLSIDKDTQVRNTPVQVHSKPKFF